MRSELNSKKEVFLATTALEEFWDTSKPIVFLGDQCCLYGRQSFWKTLKKKEILPSWLKEEEFYATSQYLDKAYEKLLVYLSGVLNNLHGVNYSDRYWRIVVGTWLIHYVHAIYDRYRSLTQALDNYPDFSTICLAEESFVIPRSTNDFVVLLVGDFYNLQLYSKILPLLDKECPTKAFKPENVITKERAKSFGLKVKVFIRDIFYLIVSKLGRGGVYLINSYFPPSVERALFIRTGGRVKPLRIDPTFDGEIVNKTNHDMRSVIKNNNFVCDDIFERILIGLLPYELPYSFIETYEIIKERVNSYFPKYPQAIFSSVSWTYDDLFKQWGAAAAEKGTLLLGAQHGGNYGAHRYMAAENYEINITDKYYSWGWEKAANHSEIVPFYAPLLIGRKPIGAKNSKAGIFFVTTCLYRYLYRFQYESIDNITDYIKRQFGFVSALDDRMKQVLKVRLNILDYGWICEKRWTDLFNKTIHLDKGDKSFVKSLNNCRVAVFDHLSTTFMEALAIDKPAILFGRLYELSPEAKPYYDELRRVGIYYATPEEAALAVNSFYPDVEAWWNDPERKKVVASFCSKFVRTSKNAINEWVKEFKKISAA